MFVLYVDYLPTAVSYLNLEVTVGRNLICKRVSSGVNLPLLTAS
jgi:hypothetical protein